MEIGTQVKKRRQVLGLTMQDVVDRLRDSGTRLSKTAISKYESGKSVPKATTLRALARALECSTDYLLSESQTPIQWLRFRKKSSLSKRMEVEVKETARQWLQAKLLVRDSIDSAAPDYQLPSVAVAKVEDAEAIANGLRRLWEIGDWPIESLSVAIERSGVMVVEVDVEKDLDGLSGVANLGVRFVVVGTGMPADRMRMNLAHELGHIVITPTEDERFDEQVAFRFGAALMVPQTVMFDRIGRSRRTVSLQELLLLKEEYGISIQALIRRCFDLGIVSEWTYRQLNIELRSRGWHRDEPGDCSHLERPSMFRAQLLRCIVEGTIAETEIRSMFPEVAQQIERLESESRWDWAALRSQDRRSRSDVLRRAAAEAKSEYEEDGSLSGLELIDGDD